MLKKARYPVIFLLLALLAPGKILAADEASRDLPKLIIFHSPGCHRCLQVKQEVMPGIQEEFKGRVIFDYRDVNQIENYKMLLGLAQGSNSGVKVEIPLFYFGGKFLSGEGKVGDNLRAFILAGLKQETDLKLPSVDLVEYFKSFVPAAVIFAGLADGINPCAFTVIVFFISFLALQGYRKKELILIGSAFILAVFLTYLGLGLGIFNFLYRFSGFWVVTQLFNMIMGILSIMFGILAVYDFREFQKTGSTDALILQPDEPPES